MEYWQALLIGLLALAVGVAFCFAGFKYFLLLLPIWGFIAGFVFGANGIYYIFNEGFFATALAVVVGLLVGILFAVLSYLYYYVAVILLGASLGYMLGIGVMDWLNITGILAFIVGIVVAAVFAYGFIVLAMPAVLAIWGTAIAGAMAIVVGVLLILDRVDPEALNGGALGVALADTEWPWLWIIIGIALAVAGGFAQIRMIGGTIEQINKDRYMNPGMS